MGKISFILFIVLVYTKLILAQQPFVKNSMHTGIKVSFYLFIYFVGLCGKCIISFPVVYLYF
jgi:hypothetical protein